MTLDEGLSIQGSLAGKVSSSSVLPCFVLIILILVDELWVD